MTAREEKNKRISLNKYFMRVPTLLATLLFLLFIFILKSSAVYLEKSAVRHAQDKLDSFVAYHSAIILARDYQLLEKELLHLAREPRVASLQFTDPRGLLLIDVKNPINTRNSIFFKIPDTVSAVKDIRDKGSHMGRLRLDTVTAPEKDAFLSFFFILFGVFLFFVLLIFVFVRFYNKQLEKEFLLLKNSIEKKSSLENLKTQQFNIEELILIQQKMKSDSKDLRLLKEELQRKENLALIGNFASSIVHDIRNPVSVIEGYTEMLSAYIEDKDLPFVERIFQATRMIERLLEDILSFVREQKPELKITSLKADIIVKTALEYVSPYIKEKKIQVREELDNDLILSCDGDRLSRAIMNLLKNSIEVLPENGLLSVKTRREDGFALFTVEDNGPGIPDGIRTILFQPFTTADKKKGTGLGLFVVKNIVEAHNGTIKFKSDPGGAQFTIRLPIS